MEKLADIGVFGGSGFYKFLDDIKEVKIETPYGMPLIVCLSVKSVRTKLHLCLVTAEATLFYHI